MKYLHTLLVLVVPVFVSPFLMAQCTGGCPAGSTSIMPAGVATLAAGTTYCISTTTNLSANTYTVNGTLVIQAGTVTLNNVTINKTGVIRVKFGARLIITGVVTGNNTAPASSIDNIIVCNGGLLNITGSFSQGQVNIAINDFGVFQVTGAWTAGAAGASVKIGTGSLVELCSSFNMNKNGFFTETGSGDSYLVVHAPMIQSVANGYLSNLQNSSHIKWTAAAGAAFVSHPAAYSCLACGNYNLAPTGTTNTCGSAANAQNAAVLPIGINGFYKKVQGNQVQIVAQVDHTQYIKEAMLEWSVNGVQYMGSSYPARIYTNGNTTTYEYSLPIQENAKYYRFAVETSLKTQYSTVLLPGTYNANGKLWMYPNETGDGIWMQLPEGHTYTRLIVCNGPGQVVHRQNIGMAAGLTQYRLLAHMAPGIYFVKLTGARGASTMRLVKKQ